MKLSKEEQYNNKVSHYTEEDSLRVKVDGKFNLLPIMLRLQLRLLRVIFPLLIQFVSIPKLIQLANISGTPWRIDPEWIPAISAYIDRMLRGKNRELSNKCLLRSFLQYHFLNRAMIKTEFNIGLCGDKINTGHAWVSVEGKPVFDSPAQGKVFSEFLYKDKNLSIIYWFLGEKGEK